VSELGKLLEVTSSAGLDRWVERRRRSMGVAKVDYRKLLQAPGGCEVMLERLHQACCELPPPR
jgi:hypothetical protein